MKRKAKRFTERADIITAIDDAQHKLAMARKLGSQHAAAADALMKELALIDIDKVTSEKARQEYHGKHGAQKEHRQQAGVFERAIPRHESTLHNLKDALAVFDTTPMPFLTDNSVEL